MQIDCKESSKETASWYVSSIPATLPDNEIDQSDFCDDEEKVITESTTPTTPFSTTTENPHCSSDIPMFSFKRTRGYWCMASSMTPYNLKEVPLPWEIAVDNCHLNDWQFSSLEVDAEWKKYRDVTAGLGYITGVWVAMDYNKTSQKYEWTDGQALPELRFPQPEVIDPNGKVAWIIDFTATAAPYGKLAVVPATGQYSPLINMGLCGVPGTQFF